MIVMYNCQRRAETLCTYLNKLDERHYYAAMRMWGTGPTWCLWLVPGTVQP